MKHIFPLANWIVHFDKYLFIKNWNEKNYDILLFYEEVFVVLQFEVLSLSIKNK